MKTFVTASLVAAAALSLAACGKPAEENVAAPAEASFNEADIPAEGNSGALDEVSNGTAGLGDPALANDATAIGNTGNSAEPVGNAL